MFTSLSSSLSKYIYIYYIYLQYVKLLYLHLFPPLPGPKNPLPTPTRNFWGLLTLWDAHPCSVTARVLTARCLDLTERTARHNRRLTRLGPVNQALKSSCFYAVLCTNMYIYIYIYVCVTCMWRGIFVDKCNIRVCNILYIGKWMYHNFSNTGIPTVWNATRWRPTTIS